MEITYRKENDYFYPNLELPEQKNKPIGPIGKYGNLRLEYLQKHRRGTYTTLLTECKLNAHLYETDIEANRLVKRLIEEMAAAQGVTEELKAEKPMEWFCRMNNLKAAAEEIVFREVVYQ